MSIEEIFNQKDIDPDIPFNRVVDKMLEDQPLTGDQDSVVIFEGITKEAADQLKDRIAALKSALRKIRDAGCYNCSMAAQNALEEDDG